MKSGPLLFLGIFGTTAFSWAGILLTTIVQQNDSGATKPYYDVANEQMLPAPLPGVVRQGQQVYQDLGCVYCHTQQVQNPVRAGEEKSPDVVRGWGQRPSVARDYVQGGHFFLGSIRTGPDLRNVGERPYDADWHYKHLYNPLITTPNSKMPPSPFLFETRQIVGERAKNALDLPPEFAPPDGYEVVPTSRADALVAYLLSLKTDYSLPEAAIPAAQ